MTMRTAATTFLSPRGASLRRAQPHQQRVRRRGALLTLLVTGALTLAGPASAAPSEDPDLDQRVGTSEVTVTGPDVLTAGHVDIGPRFLDGTWTMQARDDRTAPPVWRATEETVLHVLDEAILPAPDSPDFAFLAAEPGTPLYVVPQGQNQDVVWIGWNTQDPEVTERIDRGATLRLDAVTGPGDVFLFLQEGVTGPPNVLWDSTVTAPQDLWMEVNTHVHANWVFTAPGVYTLEVTMLADLVDGTHVEDAGTLSFAIGTSTDPQAAFPVDPAVPAAGHAPATTTPPTADAPSGDTTHADADDAPSTTTDVAVWAGAAAAVLAIAVSVSVLRGRRARRLAEAAADADMGDVR